MTILQRVTEVDTFRKFVEKINNVMDAVEYIGDYVTPEMYGAKGDGVTNDTDAIQQAINHGVVINFAGKTYVTDSLVIPDNTCLNLQNSILKFNIGDDENIKIIGKKNVVIYGGILQGGGATVTKDLNYGLIHIESSNNIVIKGVTCYDAPCDSFVVHRPYVGEDNSYIWFTDVVSDRAGRNGLAITSGQHIYVTNSFFMNATKFVPKCGIDFEPNFSQDTLTDIHVNGCVTKGNKWSAINITTFRTTSKEISVNIENHTSIEDTLEGTFFAINIDNDHSTEAPTKSFINKGYINISNLSITNAKGFITAFRGLKIGEISVNMDGIIIRNASHPQLRIYGIKTDATVNDTLGDFKFKGITDSPVSIHFPQDTISYKYSKLSIITDNYPLTINNITDKSKFDNTCLFSRNVTLVNYNINTVLYNGITGTMDNKWGNLVITKVSTGKYSVAGDGALRGIIVTCNSPTLISSYDYSTKLIEVKNLSGVYTDAKLCIMSALPIILGTDSLVSNMSQLPI